jgi:hypothetical protein
MFVPSVADAGAVLVTPRSAEVATVLVAATVLLAATGSAVDELTKAVFVIVEPPGAPALTFTTSVNGATAGANDELPQLTVPAASTAGVVHIQPAGDASEMNVVPAGKVSVSVAFCAGFGPAFATPIV